MADGFLPSRDDYESVDRAVARLQARGWRCSGLNQLVEGWAQLVEEVETGYDDDVAEFTNDLSCRTAISEALPFLTADVAANLEERIASIDRRFVDATDGVGDDVNMSGRWWMARRLRPSTGES